MIDYLAARAVAMVVQTGSFDKAAKALNVTQSAVSQRIKHLEERLGAVLIERGTPCTATEKGAWLCRHMEHVGMLEKELMTQLPGLIDPQAPAQRVTLNIAVNSDSLATWFLPAAADFTKSVDYLLNITVDDEDHTAEWLQRGRVLAAVTSVRKPVQGCQVKPLGKLRYIATATPAYIERYFPNGLTADAFANAPVLLFNQKDHLQLEWVRRVTGQAVACPAHWVPSTYGFVDAGLVGMGWGLNPLSLIKPHLEAGRLVELKPQTPYDVELYWQINRLAADQLANLTRSIVTKSESELRG